MGTLGRDKGGAEGVDCGALLAVRCHRAESGEIGLLWTGFARIVRGFLRGGRCMLRLRFLRERASSRQMQRVPGRTTAGKNTNSWMATD